MVWLLVCGGTCLQVAPACSGCSTRNLCNKALAQRCTLAGRCAPLRCACALSPAPFVLVCDACARSSVHTLGHNSWQPVGDRGRAHQCDPGHIHTLRGSEGGHPCDRREVIHAIQGRPSTRSRKVIHVVQGRRSTRCSMRSKGGDPCVPREVIRGRSPQAPRELITVLKEGRSKHALGEVIRAIQGRSSTSSMRSEGGDPRAPREVIHAIHPRYPREVFHAL